MTRDEVKRVIGYVRVSTEEQGQSGLSLEAQEAAIRAKATSRGWEVVRIAKDVASGKSVTGRVQLKAALEDLKAVRADGLIVTKLDRGWRSVVDFGQTLRDSAKQGWVLVMLELDLDTSTPTGKAMAQMLAVMAEFERDMAAQRTREALAAAKARGTQLGRKRSIAPALEKRILRLRGKGESFVAIAERLNQEAIAAPAGGTWGWTTIRRVVERAEVA